MPLFDIRPLRLDFTLAAEQSIHLPAYKGSAFHGGFGHALQTLSPRWFDFFYRPATEVGRQLPKPFVLLPPQDPQQHYQPGETFNLQLTLFGEAAQHYAITEAAIDFLGAHRGLGHSRGKYRILNITRSMFKPSRRSAESLNLQCITRIRLKHENRLLKQAPEFQQLIAQLFRRLKTLQHIYCNRPVDDALYHHHLQQAAAIRRTDSDIYWDDWDRFSGSQQKWMKFGGLLGQISYQGDLQPFLPTLQMGEWTHIGGKSSFGLGKYSIHMREAT